MRRRFAAGLLGAAVLAAGGLAVGVPAHAALIGTSITYAERTDEGLQILVSVPADATVDTADVAVTIDGTTASATAVPADDTTSVRRTAILVIDTSNSMSGKRIAAAQSAAETFLDTVPEDVYVGVVTFDSDVAAALAPTLDRDEARAFALPLHTHAGPVAVVSGVLPAGTAAAGRALQQRLDDLGPALSTLAVHLDTAMLFTRLRDAATADERRRLAREMHDGVAQDIASLGYLVDALAVAPASPAQAESLRRLRERITAVVAQVRLSVQTLRTDVQASESLGAAVSGLARHLSDSSGIPIRVTVNERTARLRPEIEAELLRITQEAMTNAVRHAHATAIDVTCRVTAPSAEIMVRDDGRGLGPGRPDSYGLAIMRERAGLIDADLVIDSVAPSGTVVTVRVPSRHASASRAGRPRSDRVTA